MSTSAAAKKTYYTQTRRTDSARPWETHTWVGTERTALRHLASYAENSGTNVIVRVVTGNPYSGEGLEVVATRNGELAAR